MWRALSLIRNPALTEELSCAWSQLPGAGPIRSLSESRNPDALMQAIRVDRPDLLFIPSDELQEREGMLADLNGLPPIIAVGTSIDAPTMRSMLHLGIRGCVESPIDAVRLAEEVASVGHYIAEHPSDGPEPGAIYAFLPAKPGVGASTIALATSTVLANELNVRTLLMDCDLSAGSTRFLLQLNTEASLSDALEHAPGMDLGLWEHIVAHKEKLDILPSAEHRGPPSPDNVRALLSFTRELYQVTCCDLPSDMDDPLVIQVLQEARRIFLVTSAELAPIHFSKKRLRDLTDLGLADRVSVIANECDGTIYWDSACRGRTGKRRDTADCALCSGKKEMEEAIGRPITISLAASPDDVQRGVLEGSPVPHSGHLAEDYRALAKSLAPGASDRHPQPSYVHRFLEYFHVPAGGGDGAGWQD